MRWPLTGVDKETYGGCIAGVVDESVALEWHKKCIESC